VSSDKYNAEYYETFREQISEKRKSRYKSDAKYREKRKKDSREYRKRMSRENPSEAPVSGYKRPRAIHDVIVNGETVKAYSMGKLAGSLELTLDKVIAWFSRELLPMTPFKTKGRERLFTLDMIAVIQDAYNKRGNFSSNDESGFDEVLDGWADIGVVSESKRKIKLDKQ